MRTGESSLPDHPGILGKPWRALRPPCLLPQDARHINDPVWKYSNSKFNLLFFQVVKQATMQEPDLRKSNTLQLKFMYALRIHLRF